jgi:8-oxo-dGTP pyrophosphatase MutT (NUDIX family)
MVQRKDSLSYVEFMRGKYDLENKMYIMKLMSNMTDEERRRLQNNDFGTLWKDMWCKSDDENGKNFNKEYQDACEKFSRMKKGYFIKSGDMLSHMNIDVSIEMTTSTHDETEWGFPKGRRNVNENDISCAIREFREETGMTLKHIEICHSMKPMEEVFSGTNKKRYKHVYYISKYTGPCNEFEFQPSCREIKNVRWFNYNEAQAHIRDSNVERKELLKRLHHIITRST